MLPMGGDRENKRRGRRAGAAIMALAAVVWAGAAHAVGETAVAEMKAVDGRPAGTVTMVETAAGVLLTVKLTGLPPGPHAIHLYETGACTGDFTDAGGIHNPLGAKHGFLNEEGPMAGDLPNVYASSTGEVQADMLTPFVTLSEKAEAGLLDSDGAAILVREGPDDYTTDPDGNAGKPLVCGVITRK
jgi:Cu-Zn family superoxide dismutase